MPEPKSSVRPRACPQCGGRARVVSNPYFGVGLAVHSHLLSCARCQFIGFLAIQKIVDGGSAATEETRPAPGPLVRGGLARLIRLGRR